MSKSVARLYTHFQPEQYNLTLDLDETTMRFTGHVVVTGRKVGRPSKRLTFHANGLKITSGKITIRGKKGASEAVIKRINLQKSMHEVRLHTESLLYPGEYTVEMTFEAPITKGMTGIYPCFYRTTENPKHQAPSTKQIMHAKDATDTAKQLLMTQFESHHAREAFPCIDEPEAKATFDLTLITRDGVQVLGNTPVISQQRVKSHESRVKKTTHPQNQENTLQPVTSLVLRSSLSEGGTNVEKSSLEDLSATSGKAGSAQDDNCDRLLTSFETTPRMSTYLLAFVVGELVSKTAQTKSGVTVSTWATVAQPVDSLDFALDAAVKSVEYFEDYFGVPYPLAKADHVAVPDFSSGAMENWGLITYRERVLLAYPGDTGQSTREQIALVVAHETSHQWFGNLVTMRWWNDLWLNESFANMMEYQCVDSFYPDWQVWQTFIGSEGLSAFRRDAVDGVQAVRTDVHHPDEISSLFDPSIVYAKGGRLLYMLKNYIGDDAFRRGLTAYFTKHAYGNTTGDDLWAALSEASDKDVSAFMTPWLTRPGFPVLTVSQDTTSLTISQQQFCDDPSKVDESRLWPVPLFADGLVMLNSFQHPVDVLDSRTSCYEILKPVQDDSDSSAPVLLNTGSRGHYLVQYTSPETKSYLRAQIAGKAIAEADRLMALNAASMFAKAGQSNFGEALELLSAYTDESSEPVWDMMALITGEARRFVELDDSLETPLKAFCAKLAAQQIARLGWDEQPGEPAADSKLRGLVLGLGLYAESQTLIDEAKRRFAAFTNTGEQLPAELRGLIMAVPVKHGEKSAFDYLLRLHHETTNSDLKNDIADALTATRKPAEASVLLERLKDASLVKPQDADRWLVYLLRNRYTKATAWDWMVTNWSWLEETYKHDKSYDYLPRYAASVVSTPAYAERFHALFDSKVDQPLLSRNIQMGGAEIATRVAWLQRDLSTVQSFFTTAR